MTSTENIFLKGVDALTAGHNGRKVEQGPEVRDERTQSQGASAHEGKADAHIRMALSPAI